MPEGKTSSGRRFTVLPGTKGSESAETTRRTGEVFLVGFHAGGKTQDMYGCKSCRDFYMNRHSDAFSTGISGFGVCEFSYEGLCDQIQHWTGGGNAAA